MDVLNGGLTMDNVLADTLKANLRNAATEDATIERMRDLDAAELQRRGWL